MELTGELTGIGLRPLLDFLGGLRKSGNLLIRDERWTGSVVLSDGEIVGARFQQERGISALDAIFLALQHGRFEFATSSDGETNLDVPADELKAHLDSLAAEIEPLARFVSSLPAVPSRSAFTDDGEVTLRRGSLGLLMALDGQRTLAAYATERGLLVTLREIAELANLGLVTFTVDARQPVPEAPTSFASRNASTGTASPRASATREQVQPSYPQPTRLGMWRARQGPADQSHN